LVKGGHRGEVTLDVLGDLGEERHAARTAFPRGPGAV
jgi:hypothetical protein